MRADAHKLFEIRKRPYRSAKFDNIKQEAVEEMKRQATRLELVKPAASATNDPWSTPAPRRGHASIPRIPERGPVRICDRTRLERWATRGLFAIFCGLLAGMVVVSML